MLHYAGIYRFTAHRVNDWFNLFETSQTYDFLAGARRICASMSLAAQDAYLDVGNVSVLNVGVATMLANSLRLFWSVQVPNAADPETKSYGVYEKPYVLMMKFARRDARWAGDMASGAMMWELPDPAISNELSIARSFGPTTSPFWMSWWSLSDALQKGPASQKTPKRILAALEYKPRRPAGAVWSGGCLGSVCVYARLFTCVCIHARSCKCAWAGCARTSSNLCGSGGVCVCEGSHQRRASVYVFLCIFTSAKSVRYRVCGDS